MSICRCSRNSSATSRSGRSGSAATRSPTSRRWASHAMGSHVQIHAGGCHTIRIFRTFEVFERSNRCGSISYDRRAAPRNETGKNGRASAQRGNYFREHRRRRRSARQTRRAHSSLAARGGVSRDALAATAKRRRRVV